MITSDDVAQFRRQAPEVQEFFIGLSGGMDSVVLLDVLSRLSLPIRAIHINHQLSEHALQWQSFCEALCQTYGIPLINKTIQLNTTRNIESHAREARYAQFQQLVPETSVLLTAHHQRDQAETVWMRFCRGSGIRGLSGMRSISRQGSLLIWRPLLSCSHEQMISYAAERELQWVVDDSNTDLRFERNYTRQHIFPILSERWPGIVRTINRVASHCADADELLSEIGLEDSQRCQGQSAAHLQLAPLGKLSTLRRHNCLRVWIQQFCQVPSRAKLVELDRVLFSAGYDKQPCVRFDGFQITRYQDECHITPERVWPCVLEQHWKDINTPLLLPHQLGELQAKPRLGGLRVPESGLTVRFRQGGEHIKPHGRVTKVVKKLFQEHRVPPLQRHRIPLLYDGDCLVAVLGIAIAEGYQARADEPGWHIELSNKP